MLAKSTGMRVVMPDFYRGKPWDIDNFPPPSKEEFGKWWKSIACEEKAMKDIQELRKFIQTDSGGAITKVGVLGTCWGT